MSYEGRFATSDRLLDEARQKVEAARAGLRQLGAPVRIRCTHPDGFRSGQWAKVIARGRYPMDGIRKPARDVYVVQFDDGFVDLWPVEDDDAGYELREEVPT